MRVGVCLFAGRLLVLRPSAGRRSQAPNPISVPLGHGAPIITTARPTAACRATRCASWASSISRGSGGAIAIPHMAGQRVRAERGAANVMAADCVLQPATRNQGDDNANRTFKTVRSDPDKNAYISRAGDCGVRFSYRSAAWRINTSQSLSRTMVRILLKRQRGLQSPQP